MERIAQIEELIATKFKYNENRLLIEDDKNAKVNHLNLKNTGKIIIYKFDKANETFPFFENYPKAKCFCDYIAFFEKNNKLRIVAFELKSSKKNPHAFNQIEAAYCFSEYLKLTFNRLFKFDSKNMEFCGIIIRPPTLKSSTNIQNQKKHTQKSGYYVIIHPYSKKNQTFDFASLK